MSSEQVVVAVLDDYQGVALQMANWSVLGDRVEVRVFTHHISEHEALAEVLADVEVLCVMRERTPLPRALLTRLPALRLIVSTGGRNVSIDHSAAKELGIQIANTGGVGGAAVELAWALIQAVTRHVPSEAAVVRAGGWQHTVGEGLSGQTLGILGLGRIGSRIAQIAAVFDMKVITWSPHMTDERAAAVGARAVTKDALFRDCDILTVQLVLADETRGLVGTAELASMKPTAWLVNTSRGPIVDETALVNALRTQVIRGAALDVFDQEPLPAAHPLRTLGNVLATPHIGYVTRQQYEVFYGDTVTAIAHYLEAGSA